MKISVLVCTRNRPEDIVWALPSILKNIYDDYEVVIVDQSDGDETGQIVRPYLADHPNLRYVPTETRGLSPARNLAMSLATGDVIAFTDDDCETGTDWVATVARLFTEDPQMDMLYGQVHMPENVIGTDLSVPCLYFKTRREIKGGRIFGMGANMSFRRDLLEKMAGYDDILGPGAPLACSDDFDFSYRAQKAGAKVIADPSLILIHRAHRDPAQWERVSYLYGIGDAAFYGKHARCGDLRAIQTFVGRPLTLLLRNSVKKFLHKPANTAYLRGYWDGIWKSRKFGIDRKTRLYIAQDSTQ